MTTRGRVLSALGHCLDPRHWKDLAGRVARNPEFFADLLEYVKDDDPPGRRNALQRIVRHLYRRALEGDVSDWAMSTKGYASTLTKDVPWLRRQLRGTPHLGALTDVPTAATRWDYALLINHVLLAMKQEFAGYGLGSLGRAPYTLPSGGKLTPLEIAQSWSLLTNAGHLFGTFATERALLFELVRSPTAQDDFLQQVAPPLREYAADIIHSRSLYKFHYALSCWRVSRAEMGEETRRNAIDLLREFFRCQKEPQAPAQLWAFRSARQLAYHRLHLYMGIGHPIDAVHDEASIRAMSPWSDLSYESSTVAESSVLAGMLRKLDEYQFETYFASARVATDVLQHLREFRRWWNAQPSRALAIDALFGQRPDKWVSVDRSEFVHFARVKLNGAADDWLSEVTTWLECDAGSVWARSNFVISPHHAGLIGDIYVAPGSAPSPATLRHISMQVARHCHASWVVSPTPATRELWRSAATFGLNVFSLIARPGRRPLLHPAALRDDENDGGHVGYGLISATPADGLERATALSHHVVDDVRRRELAATLLVAEEVARSFPDDPMILFLGSLYLVDAKRGQLQVAEFDGAWCFLSGDSVTWFLLEHKKRKAGAGGDLKRKMKHLGPVAEEYRVERNDVVGDVSVVKLQWRPSSDEAPAATPRPGVTIEPR